MNRTFSTLLMNNSIGKLQCTTPSFSLLSNLFDNEVSQIDPSESTSVEELIAGEIENTYVSSLCLETCVSI